MSTLGMEGRRQSPAPVGDPHRLVKFPNCAHCQCARFGEGDWTPPDQYCLACRPTAQLPLLLVKSHD